MADTPGIPKYPDPPKPPPMGRPTIYSKEIALQICAYIADGWPLTQICRMESMPGLTTVYRWLIEEDKEEFRKMYTRAREDQADTMADQIIGIADDSANDTMIIKKDGKEIEVENKEWVNRSRLRVDARKWVAAKLKPRKYADRIETKNETETTIKGDLNITLNLTDEDKVQPPAPDGVPAKDS